MEGEARKLKKYVGKFVLLVKERAHPRTLALLSVGTYEHAKQIREADHGE
jgi:hypothetical protein